MSARPPASVAAVVLALVVAALALAPVADARSPKAPSLERAAAAIVVDARDGTPILAKDPDERRAIASATKLMTALLTLERVPLRRAIAAPRYDAAPIESQIGLATGERMRVADLLEALLLESANDAAVALAVGVSGSLAAFVAAMNERAAELGLDGTSYANPIGLDHPRNYSTARDQATLARRLMRDRRFARIVDMPAARLESGARPRVVANRNGLVADRPLVDGIKTGYTSRAGNVLVGAATAANGARVVSVVLGEPTEQARDADTLALLRYGLSRFRREKALDDARPVATAGVAYRDERVDLVPARSVAVLARGDQRVGTRLDAPDELAGELDAGARVGTVAVVRDGEVVRRVALLAAEPVPGAGVPRRIAATLGVSLTALVLLGIVSLTAIVGIRVRRGRRTRMRRARRRARASRERGPAGKP